MKQTKLMIRAYMYKRFCQTLQPYMKKNYECYKLQNNIAHALSQVCSKYYLMRQKNLYTWKQKRSTIWFYWVI